MVDGSGGVAGPHLLMQDARRAVGRTPARPRREEERTRATALDRAPTAEIAIFVQAKVRSAARE
jgi:hypothetical protein